LARREVAIVSPHAGATRDIIEVQLDPDGYPVTVIDTARIRDANGPVEQKGVRRARARAAEANLSRHALRIFDNFISTITVSPPSENLKSTGPAPASASGDTPTGCAPNLCGGKKQELSKPFMAWLLIHIEKS
jgi:hypothetical protein